MFLKHILKVALAGETEIAADFTQRFIRVAEQGLCLPQAAVSNIDTDAHAQLLLEFLK